jgi:hypothetical protein
MPLSFFNFGLFSVIISLNKHAVTFFFFFFFVRLGFELRACACKAGAYKAGTLPLEPHLPFFPS